jgi:hypothetical protein
LGKRGMSLILKVDGATRLRSKFTLIQYSRYSPSR